MATPLRKLVTDRSTVGARPECPEGGQWTKVFAPDSTTMPFGVTNHGELALSEGTTDIVEFHDCQQFIVHDSTSAKLRYSSLFAIFARLSLDLPYRAPDAVAATYDDALFGTPMATIFSFDSAYAPLGIQRGFNCLYFFKVVNGSEVGWEARVVPVATDQFACKRLLPKAGSSGTPLTVSVVPEVKPGFDTPPPVARWDWDATTQTQYIGIRCGAAWCEVHPSLGSGVAFNSSVPIEPLRPYAKGWYDEQILAVADQSKNGRAEVSTITGTFVPDRNLGRDVGPEKSSRFASGWKPVASVAIRGNAGGYTSKLNLFTSGESIADNEVFLCYAEPSQPSKCTGVDPAAMKCAENWFGAIVHKGTPGEAGSAQYFCVTRRSHDPPPVPPSGVAPSVTQHPPIPGVVRWRWALDDETMWVRCLNGCCEIKPHI
jgi:hypothetical protein